jgi:6-pyruvoyl-tetrahydropterin synthase
MGNKEETSEKETTSGRGMIKNFGDVFRAVQLILSRLDVLVEMLEELLVDKEEENKYTSVLLSLDLKITPCRLNQSVIFRNTVPLKLVWKKKVTTQVFTLATFLCARPASV